MKNSERLFVRAIKEICKEENISFKSFSYDWIFQLSKEGKIAFIFGYQFQINSATSQLICSDKSATSDILNASAIPVVSHKFFMKPINEDYIKNAGNWSEITNYFNKYGKVVCKKNDGTGGNQVYLVKSQYELEKAVHKLFNNTNSIAISPFLNIKDEYRVIVLDDNVELVYKKQIPYLIGDGISTLGELLIKFIKGNEDFPFELENYDKSIILKKGDKYFLNWKHNLGKGAVPQLIKSGNMYKELKDLSLKAAKVLGIRFASVDIVNIEDKLKIMEVNSGIMMNHFSKISNDNYIIAKNIYKKAIIKML